MLKIFKKKDLTKKQIEVLIKEKIQSIELNNLKLKCLVREKNLIVFGIIELFKQCKNEIDNLNLYNRIERQSKNILKKETILHSSLKSLFEEINQCQVKGQFKL